MIKTLELLKIIESHPFLTQVHLSDFCGLSLSPTYRRVRHLKNEGLVQTAKVFAELSPAELIALRDAGLGRLADAAGLSTGDYAAQFGLGRRRLKRAIFQIEALWAIREFLAWLKQRGWEMEGWQTPARADFPLPSRDGSFKKGHINLHGLGCLRKKNFTKGWIYTAIEWDMGNVAPKAYGRRWGEFYRWASIKRELFPVIIVVTLNRRRRLEILRQLGLKSSRWAMPRLEVEITTMGRLYENDWINEDGEQISFLSGLRGYVEPCRKRYSQGEPVPSSIMPAGPKNPKSVCHLDPPLGEDPGSGPVGELVRAQLALRYWPRRTLRAIALWTLLTEEELAVFLNQRKQEIRTYIKALSHLGLICSAMGRYYLSGKGVTLFAKNEGYGPCDYARERSWPVTKEHGNTEGLQLNVKQMLKHFEHTKEVREFMVRLARYALDARKLNLDHQLVSWHETGMAYYYEFGNRRQAIVPDSAAIYRIGKHYYRFWLEYDRGTSRRDKIQQKLNTYYTYYLSGAYRLEGDFPSVLFVVPEEGRARMVRDEALNLAESLHVRPLPILITTRELLKERGVAAAIWRKIDEWKMICCFEGFAHTPKEAVLPIDLTKLVKKVRRGIRRKARRRRLASNGT